MQRVPVAAPARSDVLIIGAGSAGSVLAERLSADSDCTVTVVEAGPGPSDPRVQAQITDALRLPIGTASSVVRRYPATLTERPPRTTELMRGAVVGGSGAVNGGYFCRGLPTDFDRWALPGWGWDEVLPHFMAIESDLDFPGPPHGTAGPITVRRAPQFDGCTAAFVTAAVATGFGWLTDLNAATPEAPLPPGVGAVPLNINSGTRVGPGGAFLKPAMHRSNLTVLTNTRVARLGIEGGRAVGAHCTGPDGDVTLKADRVVLSAGAIGSAQLLLLSGIGPADHLAALGIPVVFDLPVGMATVDHPEWVLPVGWTPTSGVPPLEAVLSTADGLEIRPYTAGFGALTSTAGEDPTDRPHLGVALMRPTSRGRLRLASDDPEMAPIIEHRYDSAPEDVEVLRGGAELVRAMAPATTEVGATTWSTSQHLAGTAPMGTANDPAAVLDSQCRVHGVAALWVVDGSIMPDITSRGPHATIVMIGHRAAEFVRP